MLSNNLSWSAYIDDVYAKAMKRLGIIQHFKYKLDRNSLERFYVAYVLPILEYADIVWSGATGRDLAKLDKVHVSAMRIVTGATARSNVNGLYEDIGWHDLSTRRKIHRLRWFYKILNNLAPQYLVDILPPNVNQRQNYNLRCGNNISQIPAMKELYLRSYFPSTIKEWNNLPEHIREAPILSSFNRALAAHFVPPVRVPWYGTGDRLCDIHHTRMRLGCSLLKGHLHYNLHVEDDPSCRCGNEIEDPYHFFFVCPLYDNQRRMLLESLSHSIPDVAPRLSILLRGDPRSTNTINEHIFNFVHVYFKDTKRFNI